MTLAIDSSASHTQHVLGRMEHLFQKCERVFSTTPPEVIQQIISDCVKMMAYIQDHPPKKDPDNILSQLKVLRGASEHLTERVKAAPPSSPSKKYYPCVLRLADPTQTKSIAELQAILEKLGVRAELGDGEIRFAYSGTEIESLGHRHPELTPYFRSKDKRSCFARECLGGYVSDKGLCEDITGRVAGIATLLKEANQELSRHSKATPVKWDIPMEALDSNKNLIHEMLVNQKFKGFGVGEWHKHLNPKKFFVDHMSDLAEMGVVALGLEHLMDDTMGGHLKKFFDTGIMDPILESYLDYLDRHFELEHPYTYTNIVVQAREVGIPVFGLDSSLTLCAGYDHLTDNFGPDRLRALNYIVPKRVQKINGKFAALWGNTHGTAYHTLKSPTVEESVIPGIAEILDCPSIAIDDAPHPTFEKKSVKTILFGKKGGFAHVRLCLPRPAVSAKPPRKHRDCVIL